MPSNFLHLNEYRIHLNNTVRAINITFSCNTPLMGSKFCIFVMFRKQNQETCFNKCFILLKIKTGWSNLVLETTDTLLQIPYYHFILSSPFILNVQ